MPQRSQMLFGQEGEKTVFCEELSIQRLEWQSLQREGGSVVKQLEG